MLYHFYELNHALLGPARLTAGACKTLFRFPFNPAVDSYLARSAAAACEVMERTTKRYGKPDFEIKETVVDGVAVPITEEVVWRKPFCRLLHFRKDFPKGVVPKRQTAIVIVAPMSGHYATLLRGTVDTMLPRHDVYITDWADARMVPLTEGGFDLDDYIDYLIDIFRLFGRDVHVIAVCQPSVPVLAAISVMEAARDKNVPTTMTLMGGPIDTRINPTQVNQVAERQGVEWFRKNVIMRVPWPHPGFMRPVYPGFLQLTGFMTMNMDRHLDAHKKLFTHLVEGDGDSVEKHKAFYDEYLAVMDLTAEFYLQTVDTVFVRHALPKGEMMHRGERVDPSKIKRDCHADRRRRERRHHRYGADPSGP